MKNLIWLIVVILIIGWLLGFFAFPALGGIIHILLVVAVILILYKIISGRRL